MNVYFVNKYSCYQFTLQRVGEIATTFVDHFSISYFHIALNINAVVRPHEFNHNSHDTFELAPLYANVLHFVAIYSSII